MNDKRQLWAAIERLQVHDHLCLIYETQEELLAAVVPFIRIGLERGEKCGYVADENTAVSALEAMRADGIDVDSAVKSGALTVLTKTDSYVKDGCLDPDRLIRILKEVTGLSRQEGYSALRCAGEAWMLGAGDPCLERLIEYEAKINYFFPENDTLAICQYNRRHFSPEVLMDVIRTHPLALSGGEVCKNIYYVPPDEFLKPDRISLEQVERLLHNIIERQKLEETMKAGDEKKNSELETLLKGFVNREIRMVELKEKIRELEDKLNSRKSEGHGE